MKKSINSLSLLITAASKAQFQLLAPLEMKKSINSLSSLIIAPTWK